MRSLILFGLVIMQGCAASQPRVIDYTGRMGMTFRVIYASPHDVERGCEIGTRAIRDDGTSTSGARLIASQNGGTILLASKHRGCWREDTREIWLSWNATVGTLLHELCHADGMPPMECEKIH